MTTRTYYIAYTDNETHVRTVRAESLFRACSEARGTEVVRSSRQAAIAASERKEATMDRVKDQRDAEYAAWKHEQSLRA